jgi:1-acyl-sn-glycerol-3-phosphate acyltransferase
MDGKKLFTLSFLGWLLKIGKNISVDRENPKKALQAMHEAADSLKCTG